ncbi:hypothetical protein SK642_1621 [Streptococcus mitis]|uniref:Uncharacterized protein n=1 Tax=Streptococcus mitis TaxID=28037 RepID=A0A081Q966_STRMT|nr:hypothetical protein SK642_1621 [Streptococcus mitis]
MKIFYVDFHFFLLKQIQYSLLLAFKSPLEAKLVIEGKFDKQDSQAHTETGKNV